MSYVFLAAIALWFAGALWLAVDWLHRGPEDPQHDEPPVTVITDINRAWARAAWEWEAEWE